jgi:opacity protein-like surface antigen
MKKFLAILMFFFLAASLAQASVGITRIGIMAGANLASLTGTEQSIGWKSMPSFVGGAFLTFSLADFFAIEPEILYSQKGSSYSEGTADYALTTSIRLAYLDFPLLAKFYVPLGEESRIRPMLFAGPYLGWKIRSKLDITYEDAYGPVGEYHDLTGVKSTDTGLVVGGGINLDVKGETFIIDIRYSASFATISKTEAGMKNHVFSIMIGYSFI